MSRSYKKNPWVKDNPRGMKTVHARRMRHIAKQSVRVFHKSYSPEYDIDDDDWFIHYSSPDPIIPDYRSVTCQWDICDWKFYSKEPSARRK